MCVNGCVDACSRVHMVDVCVDVVCMYAAQEEEKCLAADAGRLTHGPTTWELTVSTVTAE